MSAVENECVGGVHPASQQLGQFYIFKVSNVIRWAGACCGFYR